MNNLEYKYWVIAAILFCCFLISCQKDSDENEIKENEVTFAIDVPNFKSVTNIKGIEDYSLVNADKIVLTILNTDGSSTKYTSSDVNIEQMNGVYYTQKLVLKNGTYHLTEFLVIDGEGNTIFAAPLAGSQEAQNVSNALPITFTVAKDLTIPVSVEVLSTEKRVPENFGLNRFTINDVKTFSFLIGVVDKQTDELLSASLTVSNGSYSYSQTLDSIANNVVTIKDNMGSYTLVIEKNGYHGYSYVYPIDSLKMHSNDTGNLPLLIEVEKIGFQQNGLVAYYPFDGNANDVSGNGYNGVVYGANLSYDRKGNINSAYNFDGDDYIDIPLLFNFGIRNYSVTVWFKSSDINQTLQTIINSNPHHELLISFNHAYYPGKITFYVSSTGYWIMDSKGIKNNFIQDQWYFISFVKNGDQYTLKVNTQFDQMYQNPDFVEFSLFGNFNIGRACFNSEFFKGSIDDVRIYDRALDDQEIESLYNE